MNYQLTFLDEGGECIAELTFFNEADVLSYAARVEERTPCEQWTCEDCGCTVEHTTLGIPCGCSQPWCECLHRCKWCICGEMHVGYESIRIEEVA